VTQNDWQPPRRVENPRPKAEGLVRMPFPGCVLVFASCSAHIASETAPGCSRAFGFNTIWQMPVRPTASTLLSPVWTPATSNSTSWSTTHQSPDATLSPPPPAEVYLVENRLNPISTRAGPELTDDNLRCTVKEYSKWVEEALGISDLRSRLQAGEAVVAFDFRRDQLKIKCSSSF